MPPSLRYTLVAHDQMPFSRAPCRLRRVRIKSSGYVDVTEQSPAHAPATSLSLVHSSSLWPGGRRRRMLLKNSNDAYWIAEYGIMRMTLVPLPRKYPRQPSVLPMLTSVCRRLLCWLRLWTCKGKSQRPPTWKIILRRSRGETVVRETAPAIPPASRLVRISRCWLLLCAEGGGVSRAMWDGDWVRALVRFLGRG